MGGVWVNQLIVRFLELSLLNRVQTLWEEHRPLSFKAFHRGPSATERDERANIINMLQHQAIKDISDSYYENLGENKGGKKRAILESKILSASI